MTAAATAARAGLAHSSRAVLDGEEPGARLALCDARAVSTWDDLARIPSWLHRDAAARRRLARYVALLTMADDLANTIDGDWLGALAAVAGEEVLDSAIEHAGTLPAATLGRVEADALEARGFAVLAASLPPSLRGRLPGAPEPLVERDHATALIAMAEAS